MLQARRIVRNSNAMLQCIHFTTTDRMNDADLPAVSVRACEASFAGRYETPLRKASAQGKRDARICN